MRAKRARDLDRFGSIMSGAGLVSLSREQQFDVLGRVNMIIDYEYAQRRFGSDRLGLLIGADIDDVRVPTFSNSGECGWQRP
jgi:hypothetical protein